MKPEIIYWLCDGHACDKKCMRNPCGGCRYTREIFNAADLDRKEFFIYELEDRIVKFQTPPPAHQTRT